MSRATRVVVGLLLAVITACDDDKATDHEQAKDGGTQGPADASGTDAGDAGLSGAALVERGRYLVENVAACGDCHTPRKPDGSPDLTRALAGVPCFVDAVPADPSRGCLPSRNLTHHESGLKNRSDAEIKDMILKGLRPDGKALHPVMPYYVLGNMREQDADAMVAYLRTVPGVDHMVGPAQAPFLPPEAPAPRWPDSAIPRPLPSYPEQAAAERGRYLAGSIGICMECHTARDANGGPQVDKAFQGMNQFPSAELGLPPVFPPVIYASNLTPHATGIASYTVDDLVKAIKQGTDANQGGSPLCPPMPSGPMGAFRGITDEDARDIAHYLRSIPPVESNIPSDCQPPAAPASP